MLEFLIDIPLRAHGGDLEQGQRIALNMVSPGHQQIGRNFFADFLGRWNVLYTVFLRGTMPSEVTPKTRGHPVMHDRHLL